MGNPQYEGASLAEKSRNGMISMESSNNIVPPSKAQLALAIAIVKHKPEDVDVKGQARQASKNYLRLEKITDQFPDYILQIRQQIKRVKDSPRDTSRDNFFDSVSFWQQAYEKSEAAQTVLLDRIYELEQRVTTLRAKLDTNSFTGLQEQESKKRKTSGNNTNVPIPKRAKTRAVLETSGLQPKGTSIVDRFEYLEECTVSFTRHFFALQRALQKRPDRSSIVYNTVRLSKTAAENILTAVSEKEVTNHRSKPSLILQARSPELTSILHAVECVFDLLYKALDKLSTMEDGLQAVGQVTYHLVCLFDALLKALQQSCLIAVAQNMGGNSNSSKANQSSGPKRPKQGQRPQNISSSKLQGEDSARIRHLIATMALSLNNAKREHRRLLDGFLFVLLTRVGELLRLFEFRDIRLRPDLQIDPEKLPLPKGLSGADLSERSLQGAQLEGKHLIWLLERILAFLDARPRSSQTISRDEGRFVSKIKAKLQSTLIQAVFGTKDPLFKYALPDPRTFAALEVGEPLTCSQMPDHTDPEWFTQEVWRLLGWDTIVKKAEV